MTVAQPQREQARGTERSAVLRDVSRLRVLFAHHSVGSNVLTGVSALLAEGHATWRVTPVEGAPAGPGLLEATPGTNGDPLSKIDGFAALVRQTRPAPDVALMKLCFVDITDQTDLGAILAHYTETIRQLEAEFPRVAFLHVTVPLVVRSTSVKTKLYRLVGRSVWGDAGNAARAEYNRLLRASFPTATVFDLAQIEATRPDGALELHPVHGAPVPFLAPAYSSDDSGHLNALGQQATGEAFVEFLARAPLNRTP